MAQPQVNNNNTVEETLNRSRLLTSALRASRLHAGGNWGGNAFVGHHGFAGQVGHGYGYPQHFGYGYQVPQAPHWQTGVAGHHFGGFAPTVGEQHIDLETKNTDGTTTTTHLAGGNTHWGVAGQPHWNLQRSGLWTGAQFGGHWPNNGHWAGQYGFGHGGGWRNHHYGGFTGGYWGAHQPGFGHFGTAGSQFGHPTAPHVDVVTQQTPTYTVEAPVVHQPSTVFHGPSAVVHNTGLDTHVDVVPAHAHATTGLNYASHWGVQTPAHWGNWGHGGYNQGLHYQPQWTGHHPWFSQHATAPQHVDFVSTAQPTQFQPVTAPVTKTAKTEPTVQPHFFGGLPQHQHQFAGHGHFGGFGAHGGFGVHQTAPFTYTSGNFGHGGFAQHQRNPFLDVIPFPPQHQGGQHQSSQGEEM